ncbi:hypothetical protein Rhopal_001592-T1 [Rhodotorula paludigena]|uniref:Syntaxin N-terminal domain-containing protein n=1 Tax=Rhodotorula paludigena TaxID=86838 RepID=A0AAV5G7T2_9BASI|nr:hypothetical protein Rhopal_001592-T1 [Rhodotorula paludigena]
MSGLLNLPGTGPKQQGYAPLNTPDGAQPATTSCGIKEQQIELGDIANDAFYNEVASIRDGIRELDSAIDAHQQQQLHSLQAPSEDLSLSLMNASTALSSSITSFRTRIATLGAQVEGEAKRGHWDSVKQALQRAVEKWQRVESAHREKVRDKIGRQMRIVNPAVTDEEIKQAVDTSSGANPPQVFQQALVGSRTAAAQSALNEAKTRRSELLAIEAQLVELAALMQQVAELVIQQDTKFITLEDTAQRIEADVEKGLQQVSLARVTAAATRHKRKMCAALGGVLVLILVVVLAVELGGGKGGGVSSEEIKTETVSATATAQETAAATAAPSWRV